MFLDIDDHFGDPDAVGVFLDHVPPLKSRRWPPENSRPQPALALNFC
jgi:hypothetical protein